MTAAATKADASPARRRGRPTVWGERVQVLARVSPDLHAYLRTKAEALGFKTVADYAWVLLDEGSGYDGPAPMPAPMKHYGKRLPEPPTGTDSLPHYRDRSQVAIRVPQEFRDYLADRASRLGFKSLSDYAWALLNEESGFNQGAPTPQYRRRVAAA